MAEAFGDTEAAEKIRAAATVPAAEEVVKAIKGYDEAVWNAVKAKYWEEAQKLKVEQVRWIQNLLIYSNKTYLAVSSQDKVFGTGWRKNRQEAAQPRFWDGENQGGKILMRLRDQLKPAHSWMGPNEEQEAEKKYQELRRNTWRRVQNDNRFGGVRPAGDGSRGRGRGRGSPRGGGSFPKRSSPRY